MKYFIDFEMLSPDYRIGQIGCVNVKGEEFFVHITYNNSEIAKIARGILKDTVMTPDDAFSALFDWIYKDETSKPEIYCWGSKDAEYAEITTNYMSSSKARMMAFYLHYNLIDYHPQFLAKYGRDKNMKLEHAAKLLDPTIKQAHIAIEDAKILRMVYLLSDTFPVYDKDVVTKGKVKKMKKPQVSEVNHQRIKLIPRNNKIIASDKTGIVASFPTIEEAAKWVVMDKRTGEQRLSTIIGIIDHATKTKVRAYKLSWSINNLED